MSTRPLALGLAVSVWAMCAAWADTVELTHASPSDPGDRLPVTSVAARELPRAPGLLKGKPTYASSKPLYFEVKLGPSRASYLVALDESKGSGRGYDRLYIDANRNRDLSDDKPVEGTCKASRGYTQGEFTGGQALVTHAGERVPWHFAASYWSYEEDGRGRISLSVSAAGYCEGAVDAGGKKVKVAVLDANSNGSFNDYFALEGGTRSSRDSFDASGDWLLVDADGDGRYAIQTMGPEAFGLGRHLLLNGACYKVKVSSCGRKLAIAPGDVPCGSLTREGGGAFFAALLTRSYGMLAVQSTGEPARVPAGAYKLYACSFEAKGESGDVWRLTGEGTSSGETIRVSEGKTACAKFGTPLKVGASVKAYPSGSLYAVQRGSTLRMDLELKGQGSEVYSASSITRSGRRMAAPQVKILAKDGETVATGTFQYG